jgi:hypothetical protein
VLTAQTLRLKQENRQVIDEEPCCRLHRVLPIAHDSLDLRTISIPSQPQIRENLKYVIAFCEEDRKSFACSRECGVTGETLKVLPSEN